MDAVYDETTVWDRGVNETAGSFAVVMIVVSLCKREAKDTARRKKCR